MGKIKILYKIKFDKHDGQNHRRYYNTETYLTEIRYESVKGKGKAIPVKGREGP
jgi:hypothetical protein